MRIPGLWSPHDGIWGVALSGGNPFLRLHAEQENYETDRSQAVASDLSGIWPLRSSDPVVRRQTATEVTATINRAVRSYQSEDSDEPNANADLVSLLATLNAAPAQLKPADWELVGHRLVHDNDSAQKTLIWGYWFLVLAALTQGDTSERAIKRAVCLFFTSLPEALRSKSEKPKRRGRPRKDAAPEPSATKVSIETNTKRALLTKKLLSEPGCFRHLASRALSQQVFGPFGWLGTPFIEDNPFWLVGSLVVRAYALSDQEPEGKEPLRPLEPSALYAATDYNALLYGGAQFLLKTEQAVPFIDWDTVVEAASRSSKDSNDTAAAHLRRGWDKHQAVVRELVRPQDEDSRRREALLPVVDEPMLLLALSCVFRYRYTLRHDICPDLLLERVVWLYLQQCGDSRAAGLPCLVRAHEPGEPSWMALLFLDWDLPGDPPEEDAQGFDLGEAITDWRVAEILLPLVGCCICALLRSQGLISKTATAVDHPALGSYASKPLIRIRAFLDAASAIWRKRSKGLSTATLAEEMTINEDDLKEWLRCQPFYLSDIERLLADISATSGTATFAMGGGLLDSRNTRGHCLPAWLAHELDLLEQALRVDARED